LDTTNIIRNIASPATLISVVTRALSKSGSARGRGPSQSFFARSSAAQARLAEQYLALITQAVAEPTQPIGALEILSPRERQQVLVAFNAGDLAAADRASIHELLRRRSRWRAMTRRMARAWWRMSCRSSTADS
jgi:hypothetical protein